MTPGHVADILVATLGSGARAEVEYGRVTLDVPPGLWLDALAAAREPGRCDFFDWLSAVDELDAGVRVVAHVWSTTARHGILLRTLLPPDDLRLPSATGVWPGADWHERETAEMFGVEFAGHPAPGRLLLAEGFAGRPLRKDFVLTPRVDTPWPGDVDPKRR